MSVGNNVETVVLLRGEKVDDHVEIDLDVDKPGRTVCLLGRRKPDDTIKVSVNMDDYYQIRDAAKARMPEADRQKVL